MLTAHNGTGSCPWKRHVGDDSRGRCVDVTLHPGPPGCPVLTRPTELLVTAKIVLDELPEKHPVAYTARDPRDVIHDVVNHPIAGLILAGA